MEDPDLYLPPEEYAEFMRPIVRGILSRYGCLALSGERGQTLDKGTVSFVALDEGRFLLTAKHVVDGLFARSKSLDLIQARDPDGPSVPNTYAVYEADLLWCSETLDVAILQAPNGLRQDPTVKWFNVERGHDIVQNLRGGWDKTADAHPYLAVGTPNFGHLRAHEMDGRKMEVLGMMTIPARIVLLKSHPDGSSPMILVLETKIPMPATRAEPISQRLFDMVKNNPPATSQDLGGLSGGPLVMWAGSGDTEIIGVIHDGSVMETDGSSVDMVRATPIDEIDLQLFRSFISPRS